MLVDVVLDPRANMNTSRVASTTSRPLLDSLVHLSKQKHIDMMIASSETLGATSPAGVLYAAGPQQPRRYSPPAAPAATSQQRPRHDHDISRPRGLGGGGGILEHGE